MCGTKDNSDMKHEEELSLDIEDDPITPRPKPPSIKKYFEDPGNYQVMGGDDSSSDSPDSDS